MFIGAGTTGVRDPESQPRRFHLYSQEKDRTVKEPTPRMFLRSVALMSCTLLLAACGSKNDTAATITRDSTTATSQPTNVPSPSIPAARVPTETTTSLSPAAVVDSLYKVHGSNDGALIGEEGTATRQFFFDSEMNALFAKDLATTNVGESGNLDFDPYYNGQDNQISALKIGEPKITGDSATVVVTFNNYDQKDTLTYHLRNTDRGWKISDIHYGEGFNLAKILSQTP